MQIGLISDTHGWLDPAIRTLFRDVEVILHAGDIGAYSVLDDLSRIATLYAVRGNVDRPADLARLPDRLDVILDGLPIHLVHRPQDARPGDARVVVVGHTHRPLVEERHGVLWVNPGAAGRRGFHTDRTAALVELSVGLARVEIISLGPRSLRAANGATATGSQPAIH